MAKKESLTTSEWSKLPDLLLKTLGSAAFLSLVAALVVNFNDFTVHNEHPLAGDLSKVKFGFDSLFVSVINGSAPLHTIVEGVAHATPFNALHDFVSGNWGNLLSKDAYFANNGFSIASTIDHFRGDPVKLDHTLTHKLQIDGDQRLSDFTKSNDSLTWYLENIAGKDKLTPEELAYLEATRSADPQGLTGTMENNLLWTLQHSAGINAVSPEEFAAIKAAGGWRDTLGNSYEPIYDHRTGGWYIAKNHTAHPEKFPVIS